jgi:2-polyprenyl-6-methoxyphenol hydroxylase-like FAD-dependent oxidoreductase
MRKPQVLIIGAGTGGLCLAHGLRGAGVDVRVFERDRTAIDRLQGYRLTINAFGARALRTCLPAANFEHYIAASAKVSTNVTFLDHKLDRLLSIQLPETDQSAPEAARPISRIALRQILLEGLEDVVSFGKAFVAFEQAPNDRVIARFEDGSSAEGDVIVGADGASSRVRRQLLPHAQRVETGLIAVSGKFALDADSRLLAPPAIFKGPTLILGSRGGFMFSGAVEYPQNYSSAYDKQEYGMWGFSASRDALGIDGSPDEVPGEVARRAVLARISDWSPDLRHLVERTEASSLSTFAVKTSVPIHPWKTSRVTLLGDALHNMTPYRGIGANTALRDAASLRDALRDVNNGTRELLPALSQYEREMIDYGFAAVRASLSSMRRLHAKSRVSRFATKTIFHLLDSAPRLQRLMSRSGSY